MCIFLLVIFLLAFITFLVFAIGHVEYEHYIKKLAESKTIEQIEEKIKSDDDAIKSGSFGGRMLENILDHKELWEQVKHYKLNAELY